MGCKARSRRYKILGFFMTIGGIAAGWPAGNTLWVRRILLLGRGL